MFIEIIKAIILGLVEGITEWLPISSTGHMILIDELLKLNVSPEFMDMFLVVIQLGAISAVPLLFWHKINPFSGRKSEAEKQKTFSLWFKIIVGAIRAGVIGLIFEVFLDDFVSNYLYNYVVVALALIVYGIIFILIENKNKSKSVLVAEVEALTYSDALKIGFYQVLSLIPGTSRSGSTMIGGLASGVSRTAISEFSFLMAIPIMLGASSLKLLKYFLGGFTPNSLEVLILLVGLVISFVVSLFSIKFLLEFVRNHTFKLVADCFW